MTKISLLGIGNILLSDEGYGVRVIEELQRRYRFPDNVQILDGGTLGMDLLRFITGSGKLLVVDAIAGDGPPGEFYRFAGDEVHAYFSEKVSLHELGIKDVLDVLDVLGQPLEDVVVMGVQPATLELGLELSAAVKATIDKTIASVMTELTRWQVDVAESEPLRDKPGWRGDKYCLK